MESVAVKRRVGLAEAKNKLSALTAEANLTDTPFVIMKNNLPWVEVRPLAPQKQQAEGRVAVRPLRREVDVPNIDDLFAGYSGGYTPREDGFASSAGREAW